MFLQQKSKLHHFKVECNSYMCKIQVLKQHEKDCIKFEIHRILTFKWIHKVTVCTCQIQLHLLH